MEKVAILTASRVEPSVSITPRPDLNRILSPVFQFQKLLSFAVLFVYLWACHISRFSFAVACFGSKYAASHGFLAAKFGIIYGSSLSGSAIMTAWDSKTGQKVRRKLWDEVAIFLLGGGNILFLIVFWPGWWLMGACWALWMLIG